MKSVYSTGAACQVEPVLHRAWGVFLREPARGGGRGVRRGAARLGGHRRLLRRELQAQAERQVLRQELAVLHR